MADQRLRELERAARGGDAVAQTAYLVELVRVGEYDDHRLRLCAFLRHGPSVRALRGAHSPGPGDFGRWARALVTFGVEPALRASVAGARACLPSWQLRLPSDTRPLLALRAAEDWLSCPCETHANIASVRAVPADAAGVPHVPDTELYLAATLAGTAAWLASYPDVGFADFVHLLEVAESWEPERLRSEMESTLLEWALPVALRV